MAMALTLEDMMDMALTLEETWTVAVHMLTGGMFSVRIRPSDPLTFFPKQFAEQSGLNVVMVKRFRFYLHDLDEGLWAMDEDVPLSEWRSIHSAGMVSWANRFPHGLPSQVYLRIEDDTDEVRLEKLAWIRGGIRGRGGDASMPDEALWGDYLSWCLYTAGATGHPMDFVDWYPLDEMDH